MKKILIFIIIQLINIAAFATGETATTDSSAVLSDSSATMYGTVYTGNSAWIYDIKFQFCSDQYWTDSTDYYGAMYSAQPTDFIVGSDSTLSVYATADTLSPGTTYRFRIIFTREAGDSIVGSQLQFTTPGSPTISVGSLTSFGTVFVDSTSAEKSYSVSGTNLTNDIVIKPDSCFEISLTSGSGFKTDSLTLTPASGTVVPTQIYVVFKPTAVQSYVDSVISHESSGASTQNVLVNGSGIKAPPVTQSYNISALVINSTDISIQWTKGSGDYRIVKVNDANSFTDPVNGTSPSANTVWGGSEQVIYNGTGSSANVTNLNVGTTYYFRVYDYNNTGASTQYNTNTATDNPKSFSTPTPTINVGGAVADFGGVIVDSTSAEDSYTVGGNFLVDDIIIKPPSDFQISLSSGSGFTPDSLVLTPTSGIVNNTSIYVRFIPTVQQVYSNNISHTSTSATTETMAVSGEGVQGAPATQVTNFSFSSITSTSCLITWTSGSGDGRIVKMNTVNSFTDPADGDDPGADASWNSAGEQVIYNGSSFAVGISGLSATTKYYFRAYEYNNSGTNTKYITTTAANNPDSLVSGGTITWTSASTVAWNSSSNWSPSFVPESQHDVVINAGGTQPEVSANSYCNDLSLDPLATLTINSGKTLNVGGNLTVNSSATGTASLIDMGSLSVTGTNTVEIYLDSASRYYYVSPPISDAAPNDEFSAAAALYEYNTTGSAWSQISLSSSTALNAGQGYATKFASVGQTISFTGTLNTGSQSLPVVYAGNYWNLVGNPYPSAINWDNLSRTNVSTTIWYRTSMVTNPYTRVFDTYNATGGIGTDNNNDGTDANQYIQPMQAFWVKTTGASPSPSLNVTNNERTHTTQIFFKEKERDNICRLKVFSGDYVDETIIYFFPDAKLTLDDYDSEKRFVNDPEVPQIYTSTNDGNSLVINGLPTFESKLSIPLGFKTQVDGSFIIKSLLEELNNSISIILEDKTENVFTDLRQSDYSFASDITDNSNRFILHFYQLSTSSDSFENEKINIYAYLNNIYIDALNYELKNAIVQIYSIDGKVVTEKPINNNQFTIITMNSHSGYYLVKIITKEEVFTKKLFIYR